MERMFHIGSFTNSWVVTWTWVAPSRTLTARLPGCQGPEKPWNGVTMADSVPDPATRRSGTLTDLNPWAAVGDRHDRQSSPLITDP